MAGVSIGLYDFKPTTIKPRQSVVEENPTEPLYRRHADVAWMQRSLPGDCNVVSFWVGHGLRVRNYSTIEYFPKRNYIRVSR